MLANAGYMLYNVKLVILYVFCGIHTLLRFFKKVIFKFIGFRFDANFIHCLLQRVE